ncbi:MAG: hypothetical protein Q8Q41_00630 [bacterium]|nr:hypothetical protein [bacterium]
MEQSQLNPQSNSNQQRQKRWVYIAIGVLVLVLIGAGVFYAVRLASPSSQESAKREVTITINEAELEETLKKARDSQRLSDLSSLSAAIGLFLVTADSLNDWNEMCAKNKLYRSIDGSKAVNGTGWLPIDLSKIPGGSPLVEMYADPMNTPTQFYSFACKPTGELEYNEQYEIDANFESSRYASGGSGDLESGGSNPNLYEVGTNLDLIP